MFKEKIDCSVGILTFNSGRTLGKALDSVRGFAEVVICDGGSTDDTLEIARKYNCKIIPQGNKCKDSSGKLIDFSCARNQLLENTSYKWFVFIDSDEYITKELADEIRIIVSGGDSNPKAYWMKRRYVIDRKIVDHASTYPNRQMRFFHKDAAEKFIKKVHERIQLKENSKTSNLNGYMHVPFDDDINDVREKWGHYIEIELERLGEISITRWLKVVYQNLKVSILFAFRLVRNRIFRKGNHMPFMLEMERQKYNFKFAILSFKNVSLRK
jgi:glycosyltransferase involved in cell wall biosynthesis